MTNAAPPPAFASDWQALCYFVGRLNLIEPGLGIDTLAEGVDQWVDNLLELHNMQMQAMGLDNQAPPAQRVLTHERKNANPVLWAEQKERMPGEYVDDVLDAVKLGVQGLPVFVQADAALLMGGGA